MTKLSPLENLAQAGIYMHYTGREAADMPQQELFISGYESVKGIYVFGPASNIILQPMVRHPYSVKAVFMMAAVHGDPCSLYFELEGNKTRYLACLTEKSFRRQCEFHEKDPDLLEKISIRTYNSLVESSARKRNPSG